jgi:hypothetical protein
MKWEFTENLKTGQLALIIDEEPLQLDNTVPCIFSNDARARSGSEPPHY